MKRPRNEEAKLTHKDNMVFCSLIRGKAVLPHDVNMVLYHGFCADGFAAALAAYMLLGFDKCEYIGLCHGRSKLPENIDGKVVAILDFSFEPYVMDEIATRTKGYIVLDHHASAADSMVNVPEVNKHFVMNQSGATIAWNFFHDDKTTPLFFRYIEDRDLWRWGYENSKQFSAGRELELALPPIGVMESNWYLEQWKVTVEAGEDGVKKMIQLGAGVVTYQDKIVANACKFGRVRRLKLAPHQQALVVNATTLLSEIGNALSIKGKSIGVSYAIVAAYSVGHQYACGRWSLSLRSLFGDPDSPQAADVSLIAKCYGGGGHRASAGFKSTVYDLDDLFIPCLS